ncbi:MAG: iron ABC transporter permease, partial [Acidimicrobiia bacterium]|nr:iron ABC transporter permease [Acidimicrobiia bacterium]
MAPAVALVLAVLGLALLVGPAGLEMGGVVTALADRLPFLEVESSLTERELTILWEIRLPRAVMGALVGATLASAGAAYQGVFRNPLADPYLLGVAAGAGLGATVAILLRAGGFPSMPLAPLAFVGAVVGVALSYGLSRTRG